MLLIAVSVFALGCNEDLLLEEKHENNIQKESMTRATGDFDPFGYVPDPGRPGPYDVCSKEYSLYRTTDPNDKGGRGIIYYPSAGNCAVKSGGLPLVVLVHATGNAVSYTSYDKLLNHLASWGFAVMAYHRNGITGQEGISRFRKHLLYTYNSSIVKNHLTADIGLIGHSSGGGTVRAVLPTTEIEQLNLKSVVLMSPAFNDYTVGFDIAKYTDNFFTINIVQDLDPTANGNNKGVTSPMKTGILDYDLFSTSKPGFTKDALFVSQLNSGHFYQNNKFCRAYVSAFLLQHLKGAAGYNKFFKYQHQPENLSGGVWDQAPKILQLHREAGSMAINDFELGSGNVTSGNIYRKIQTSYLFDQHSPHSTKLLEVKWNTALLGKDPKLELYLHPDHQWMANYKYIAFDVSQVYKQPINEGINFYVGIRNTENEAYYQRIKDHKEILNYPFQFIYGNDDLTKSHMRTYLIPLSAFPVNTDKIEAVIFRFLDPDHKSGHIVIDNVRLVK